jgi:hypothetical protein
MRTLSTAGAQIGLKLYSRIASANAVTAFFSIPASASRVVSVAAIIAKGKPWPTPSSSDANGARSK